MNSQNSQEYEICQVPSYKVNYDKSIKKCANIKTIVKVLNTDLQLHERLHKNDILKLAIDVDKLKLYNPDTTLENIFDNLSNF
jgi:hypothetical protein